MLCVLKHVKRFSGDEILVWSKFKAFADHKIHATQKVKFLSGRVKQMVEKGENAGLPAISPLATIFSKGFSLKVNKSLDCVDKNFKSPRFSSNSMCLPSC